MQEDGFEVLINNCEMIKYILCVRKKMTYLSYQEGNMQIAAAYLKWYLLSDHQKSAESLQYCLFEGTILFLKWPLVRLCLKPYVELSAVIHFQMKDHIFIFEC